MAKPKSPKPPTEAPADAEPQAEATHTSADGTVWVTTEATASENPPTEAE